MPPFGNTRTRVLLGLVGLLALLRPQSAFAPDPPLHALAPFEVVLDGLKSPQYLALDPHDALLLSEADPGRVLQLAPDRTITILIDKLEDPEGIAIDGAACSFSRRSASKGQRARGRRA